MDYYVFVAEFVFIKQANCVPIDFYSHSRTVSAAFFAIRPAFFGVIEGEAIFRLSLREKHYLAVSEQAYCAIVRQ